MTSLDFCNCCMKFDCPVLYKCVRPGQINSISECSTLLGRALLSPTLAAARKRKDPTHLGADFHRAMVATAPGEKLLLGHRPVRNWTRRTISSLFLCRKLYLFLGKSAKTAATRAALCDSNMYQIFCCAGLPTGGAYSALPDP